MSTLTAEYRYEEAMLNPVADSLLSPVRANADITGIVRGVADDLEGTLRACVEGDVNRSGDCR